MPNTPRMKWPFPAEGQDPWFEALEAFFSAVDFSGYSSREDRHIILQKGGPISFNSTTGQLTWGSDLEILAAITGFQWRLQATSVQIDDGQLVYVDLTRAPRTNVVVTASTASQVPSSDSALILAVRRGDTIYFRNGVSIKSGESLASIAGAGGGGAVVPISFQVNGDLGAIVTPTDFVDGLRELGIAAEVSALALSQEVDGSSGDTTVELFKVDPSGTETQLTTGGAATLSAGAGNKARTIVTSFATGSTTLNADDRLGIKLTDTQTGGEDLTVSVILSGSLSVPPSVPESREASQSLKVSVPGTTFGLVGSVRLDKGQIIASESHILMGVDNVSDDAELEVRSFTTTSLLFSATATGLLQDVSLGATNIDIPTSDWYDVFLRASDPGATATITGFRFVLESTLGARVRQAVNDQVTGTTFELVGSVYLPGGTIQSSSKMLMGTNGGGGDTATLEMRRFTTSALIATWTQSGSVDESLLGSNVSLPAADWYDLRLKSSGAAITAILRGMDIAVVE